MYSLFLSEDRFYLFLAPNLFSLVFYFDHLRIPVGPLRVVERNRVLRENWDGDILTPRRGVASAAQEHLKVGHERRELAKLATIFDISPLFGAQRGRIGLLLVFFLQVGGEKAKLAESQIRPGGGRVLRRRRFERRRGGRTLPRHVQHLLNLGLGGKNVQLEQRRSDIPFAQETVVGILGKDSPKIDELVEHESARRMLQMPRLGRNCAVVVVASLVATLDDALAVAIVFLQALEETIVEAVICGNEGLSNERRRRH